MKNFLYLVQGKKRNVLKYAGLQNLNSDLCICTFDEEISNQELNAKQIIFFPNSTWAEGRNKQLTLAKILPEKYLYYIFLDDDAVFLKGDFKLFQEKLLHHEPAIGLPLTTIIKNTNRYNPKLAVQHPFAFDQIVQAYHYKVVEDEISIPFITDFDHESWWYSCQINEFLSLAKYKGHVMQFNDLLIENTGHVWDEENQVAKDENSNYKGGVTEEGLQKIREYIELRWGEQPKLKNTLFHDHLFKESKSIFKKIFQKKYPAHLIINETDFKKYGK
ncbi:hypothetical protein [Pedobacter sp. SL55]|uniref:hypothetical protein n=1 Tax=Pedobacter sp. SL55 TaxID=2995161 RepID=UPI00226F8315|nr:hypothetical protein [Pedobacter sp. SL55]WAC41746.1 hypothetical protein OVA16_05120 [Pedobacter sp. SL55]